MVDQLCHICLRLRGKLTCAEVYVAVSESAIFFHGVLICFWVYGWGGVRTGAIYTHIIYDL